MIIHVTTWLKLYFFLYSQLPSLPVQISLTQLINASCHIYKYGSLKGRILWRQRSAFNSVLLKFVILQDSSPPNPQARVIPKSDSVVPVLDTNTHALLIQQFVPLYKYLSHTLYKLKKKFNFVSWEVFINKTKTVRLDQV